MYSLPQSYNQTSKCKRCISSNAYKGMTILIKMEIKIKKTYNFSFIVLSLD